MLYREVGQYKTTFPQDMAIFPIREDRIAMALILAAAFVAMPLLGNDYILGSLMIPFLIYALAAIGLNILTGYCGQISLGTGGFMMVGAFAAWNLAIRIPEMNIILVFIISGGITAAVGVLFGLPSLRIKGLYLAVTTLAAQFFFEWLFSRVEWFRNYSPSGVIAAPPIVILGVTIDTIVERYLLTLSIVVAATLFVKNLVRGPMGRGWMAIRDMDIAAEIIGIRPMLAKLSAFAVSSFIIGVAGALWTFVFIMQVEPDAFNISRSFQILFIIIIGGLGTLLGCYLGAAFIVLLPFALNNGLPLIGLDLSTAMIKYVEYMIFGALMVFFLIVEPHGLARLWSMLKAKLRLWPFAH